MSLPEIPCIDPPLTLDESLNMILASIAMEELSLSHIINAEGEKLQYVLAALKKNICNDALIEKILEVNKSVKSTLDIVMQTQMILKGKMEYAINALEKYACCEIEYPEQKYPDCKVEKNGFPISKCAVSFQGCPSQCWVCERPLKWIDSDCSRCCSLHLSSNCNKIILGQKRCYVVSFSVNLCDIPKKSKHICIAVQTDCRGKCTDRFICHVPVTCEDTPITASASGIFIPTNNCSNKLKLTLISPDSVKINQSSICVMEI